ncbi:hypothetical protein [Paenibacillus hunanensis]|uniref:Uncharacterized protein n=1 Tax=Paenibacillus hunanensis TaxID=539262 RepID=A0ABU1J4A9_9BACL|nr:hypothetical protein [Paenibacillus hunanensis]MDR6246339.1 hypothetical protein [Paenibacillus hunanensis]GGJ30511.1 hypothetical protein GCM10008022_44110 [Paenibacillus hunanensis]
MLIIKPDLLRIFLDPLTGLADDDEEMIYYMNKPPQTEDDYRSIIKERLKEPFHQKEEKKKEVANLALRYYLSHPTIDFEGVYESVLPPFDPPHPPREFFLWIWEELFKGEDYSLNEEEYKMIIVK